MKKLMLPLMFILLLAGWNVTIKSFGNESKILEQHLAQAEEYERKKIYIDAVEEYKEVLNYMKDPYPIHLKIMDMYQQLKKYSSFIDYGEELLLEYNYPEEVVMKMVTYYTTSNRDRYAIELLKRAVEKKQDNELFFQELAELKGTYTSLYLGKDNVSSFYNGLAVFEDKGMFGLLNREGNDTIRAVFDVITPYAKTPKLATVKQANEWFCIDISGYRKLVPDQEVEELGMFGEGFISFKMNGSYGYLDSEMKLVQEPEWEYAGVFMNGLAPVKKNGKWALIDTAFELVTEYRYEDIVLSEFGFATNFKVYFAKEKGKYYLFNLTGDKLEQLGFERVRPFASTEPAAVCRDGVWGFISIKGELIIEPQYEDANSFASELAPVKIDEKWGYIDQLNRVKILPEFEFAHSFSETGCAPVLRRNWELITLVQ